MPAPTSPQPEKLPLTSPDLTQELLDQLRAAAPQVFGEDKIDFAKLRAALGDAVDDSPERYGLTWAGKRDAFRHVQTPSVGTLRPQLAESVNWDTTENLIIEGDNLEVLKLLQKPYHGQVKLIYIDPPYNTGNEFIYPDNFREGLDEYLRYSGQLTDASTAASTNRETSGRYHSAWLSMMYPRLLLARNLLREDGVIFVSIDDHEVHNLRLLMDEVFGEENFVGVFVWRRRSSSALAERQVSSDHEYVVAFQKTSFSSLGIKKDFANYRNSDDDSRGDWVAGDLTVGMSKDQRPNQYYELVDPDTGKIYSANPNRVWAYIPESMDKLIAEKRVLFPEDVSRRPMLKRFKSELKSEANPISTWLDKTGLNSEATRQMQDLMGDAPFSYPKPVSLLKTLVISSSETNDLILDFFAGSGTTAQAVLEANEEDGGNRRFILVQLPEQTDKKDYPTIAHITRERVRRVIQKLAKGEAGQLSFDPARAGRRGFRAFTLDASNFKTWDATATDAPLADQLALFADNLRAGRTDADRLYELVLKSGLPLGSKVELIDAAGTPAYALLGGDVVICVAVPLPPAGLRALFSADAATSRPVPQVVLCLDAAFTGPDADARKTNAVLEAEAHGITFKTA